MPEEPGTRPNPFDPVRPVPGASDPDGSDADGRDDPGRAKDSGGANDSGRGLHALSRAVLRAEAAVLTALTAAITVLILLNVVTRTAGMALFWVDELAIYAMIWAVLVGASMQLRLGAAIAVDLVPPLLPRAPRRALAVLVALVVLGLALALAWLSWLWYDPLGLAAAGFDLDAFSGATFNFIYREPTVTVGVPKFLVWLVVPVVACTMSLHALVNLSDAWTGRARPRLPALAGARGD